MQLTRPCSHKRECQIATLGGGFIRLRRCAIAIDLLLLLLLVDNAGSIALLSVLSGIVVPRF